MNKISKSTHAKRITILENQITELSKKIILLEEKIRQLGNINSINVDSFSKRIILLEEQIKRLEKINFSLQNDFIQLNNAIIEVKRKCF